MRRVLCGAHNSGDSAPTSPESCHVNRSHRARIRGWLLLAAFVGLNLLQAAFTTFCPLAMILKKLGATPGAAFR